MSEKPTYEELEQRVQELEKAESVGDDAVEALRESERRLSTLMANLQGMVYSCRNDKNWTMKYLSKGALELTGYEPDQLIDNRLLAYNDLIHPDDRKFVWGAVEGKVDKKSPFVIEYRIIARDGSIKWVWERGRGVYDDEGELRALEGFISEITERKRVEEALRESDNRAKAMLNAVPDLMFRMDRDGMFLDYKADVADLYVQNESILGKLIRNLGDLEFARLIEGKINDTLTTMETQVFEYQLTIPGRGERQYEGRMAPSGADEVTVIVRDITERKQADTAIRQLQKSESLGRMAGAIAHNYNNLLFTVMGNLEMALLGLPHESEAAEGLHSAMIAARRASEISNLMLAYLGQKTVKREPMDFIGTCSELIPQLRSEIPLYVTLKYEIPETAAGIDGNAAQIRQIIRNLVLNAWEALGEKPGVVSLGIETVPAGDIPSFHRWPVDFESGDSDYVCLEVTDTGNGMSGDVIEKLFDPFYSTKFTGRGLGLAVVLGTVKAHDGCISVETEPGRGSTFRVYMPLTSLETVPEADTEVTFKEERTVLVVDDDATVRKMAAMMLSHLEMKVLEAKNGREAVQVMRDHPGKIHCVLCDLTMPEMNGWETIAALRELEPEIPVVLASGYDQARVMQNNHIHLPQAFLGKPYTITLLKKAMTKAIKSEPGDEAVVIKEL